MNKCIKQLINKYEQKELWDLRATNRVKAMILPVKDWLEVFNNPTENECFAAYNSPQTSVDNHKIQGVMTQDKKYFLYEGTPRYENVLGVEEPVTFVFIRDLDHLHDSLGYAQDYLYVRSRVPEVHKNTFSIAQTYIAYTILLTYPNFSDINNYNDFLNRYTGEYGDTLCKSKGVNQALNLVLNKRKKDEDDFQLSEWEIYSEEPINRRLFYVDTTKQYTTKFTKIYLDGGIYEG